MFLHMRLILKSASGAGIALLGSRVFSSAVIKIGIVGFGRLAQAYYTPALRSIGSVIVAAIADPLEVSRAAAGRAFPKATICHDYRDFPTLDAILVASPPSTHLSVLNDVLPRRVPVFVEKPILLHGQLEALRVPCEALELMMPNFNRRLWPAYRRLREIVASGRLGNLQRAEFTLQVDVRPWLTVTSHRGDPREGGALYDLGSSQLDLIQYILASKLVRLRADAETRRWPHDQIRIEAQLASGLEVVSELAYTDRNRESIAIFGDRGAARIENPNCAVHLAARQSWRHSIEDAAVFASRALMRHRSMLRSTIRASLAEFFSAVSTGGHFSPGYADAMENIRCLDAAMTSIPDKQVVEVHA